MLVLFIIIILVPDCQLATGARAVPAPTMLAWFELRRGTDPDRGLGCAVCAVLGTEAAARAAADARCG